MTKKPQSVDVHIGRQLRLRRKTMGLSQTEVGRHVGVTYQQIQKDEAGLNRISASRLYALAQLLEVPVAWFFAGLEKDERAEPEAEKLDGKTLATAILLERISDKAKKRSIRALIKALAVEADKEGE